MASSYTSLLGFVLPVTGELSGTWGTVWNDSGTSLIDSAIAGTTTLSTDADVTLSTTTGVANQARQAIILWTANGTTTRNITAPAQSKIYTVINASAGTQSIVFRGAGPTTGVTIVKGESALVAWNGSDFIKISNTGGAASFTNVTVSGTTTLSGLTASTALALNASKEVVSVTNTGTGNNVLSASPTLTGTVAGASLQLSSLTSGRVTYAGASGLLQDSANLTFNGTDLTVSGAVNAGTINATTLDLTNLEVTNIKAKDGTAGMQIADSTGVVSFTANPVLSGGTANGVAYLNGSKVLTTGSALTFDGTNLTLGANKFVVKNAVGDSQGLQIYQAASDVSSIFNYYNGALSFGVNNTEQMRLTSTGLGIGTSSPLAKLQVVTTGGKSTIAIGDTASSTYSQLLMYGGSGKYNWSLGAQYNVNNAFEITPSTTAGGTTFSTPAFVLDSSGNLGIGTSSPGARLVVAGSGAQEIRTLGDGDASKYNYWTNDNGNMLLGAVSSYGGRYMAFFTGTSGTGTERMRLDVDGNLGIGTSSPAAKLDVNGITQSRGNIYGGTTNTTANIVAFANVASGGVGFSQFLFGNTSTETRGYLSYSHASDSLLIGTAGTTKATLDSSGNLGLGVTPSDGAKVLAIGNGTAPTTNISGGHLYVEGGALKYRGSSGTVTTIAAA